MRPNVWIQQGTTFNPNIELKRAFRHVVKHSMLRGWSVYITSGSDGDHRMDSLHYIDDAVDILHNGISKTKIESLLGTDRPSADFDVVRYDWGFHIEYDPK